MSSSSENKDAVRRRIIGLGEESFHKSYYPELQKHILELQEQKEAVEQKNMQLVEIMLELEVIQEKLIKSENKYRTLFENANDAIFILDSEFKFVDCNIKAMELYGVNSKKDILFKEAIGMSPYQQPGGEISKEVGQQKLLDALEGKPESFEWVFTINSKTVICQVSLNPFELSGERYLQAIIRNITKTRVLEHELRLSTIKTEEKERVRFAKELHDGIGPILSTIKLYMQWLEETDDEQHKKLIIQKANTNIIEAIKSLKEVSNNLSPHVLTNYGLVEALQQFIDKLKDVSNIVFDFNSEISNRLNIDMEVMLYRVCTELINNTIKHAKANKIFISLEESGGMVKFHYKDDGVGFVLEEKLRKGAGLGLHNIQNRVQSLGGVIHLNTGLGKGFEVLINLEDLTFLNGIEKA